MKNNVEKEPVPWEIVEKTWSDIPEELQEQIIADWKRTSQQGPDVGVLARRYGQDWLHVWRLLRLVLPARERKERAARARQKRAADKKKKDNDNG